jgi:hypothetical protein
MVCMHTILIQFKMNAMLCNIFNNMEFNLNKINFTKNKYAYFINYEPTKSWDMCLNSKNMTLGISRHSWKIH